MFKQLLTSTSGKQLTLPSSYRVLRSPVQSQQLAVFIRHKSIKSKATETLNEINIKTGKTLASGLQEVEDVTKTIKKKVPTPHDVNLKVGRKLASGLDSVENVAETIKEKVPEELETIGHFVHKFTGTAESKKEDAQHAMNEAKQKGAEKAQNAKQSTTDAMKKADNIVEEKSGQFDEKSKKFTKDV